MLNVKEKRFLYVDLLKTIAIFSIIFNHMCLAAGDVKVMHLLIYNFKNFGSVGVSLFLMITGVLLLNRNLGDFKSFLKKKCSRVTLPYIFWFIITIISFYILSDHAMNLEILKFYAGIFWDCGFNWYFWMVLGVYCAIPVINEFIKQKQLYGASYFLKIFIFAIIFYNILIVLKMDTFLDISFFIGPMSYLIFGYYLHNKKFNISNSKLAILGLIGFIVIFIIRAIGYPSFDAYTIFFHNSSIHLKSSIDISIFGVLEAVGIFIFIKSIYNSNLGWLDKIKKFLNISIIKRFIISVSKASYGMYLSHIFLALHYLGICGILSYSGTVTLSIVIITTIIIFFISWILVLIVNRIPHLKKYSGYS